MVKLFYCEMTIDPSALPIIDGKSDKRKKLAEFQAESYPAATEILIGLSKQIGELGYEIVPVTINDNGIQRGALSLAPMNLEQYVAFAKSIHPQLAKDEAKPDQEKGSSVSE